MRFGNFWRGILLLIGVSYIAAFPYDQNDINSNRDDKDVVTCDICIIGGGSSGTYAAVRLRDMGQKVVVVEQKGRLGGHTETFTDPATKITYDMGVIFFQNTTVVRNYFSRFNVPLQRADLATPPGVVTEFLDLTTGKSVPGFTPSDPTAALGAYAQQLFKYPYLLNGFNLPDPVPEDLLLSFGDFVTKYSLSAVVKLIFDFGQGIGDLLNTPTLYVMKLIGINVIEAFEQNSFLTTVRHDNSEIYEKIQAELLSADALLLNATVDSTKRDGELVKIQVSTPSGFKRIKAKKLLLTIPPTLQNLASFDLDDTERSLFSQFHTSGYYTTLIRNSGIPDNVIIENIGANTPFNLPNLPAIYSNLPTGIPGLTNIFYGSPTSISSDAVKDDILAALKRLQTAGTIPTTTPEFTVFSSHSPFEFTVPSSAIKDGFYRKLTALQAHRNTFWSGSAFHTHDSSMLWNFTESLLPLLVA